MSYRSLIDLEVRSFMAEFVHLLELFEKCLLSDYNEGSFAVDWIKKEILVCHVQQF